MIKRQIQQIGYITDEDPIGGAFKRGYQKGWRARDKSFKRYGIKEINELRMEKGLSPIGQTGLNKTQDPSYTGHATNKYAISPSGQTGLKK